MQPSYVPGREAKLLDHDNKPLAHICKQSGDSLAYSGNQRALLVIRESLRQGTAADSEVFNMAFESTGLTFQATRVYPGVEVHILTGEQPAARLSRREYVQQVRSCCSSRHPAKRDQVTQGCL